MALVIPPLPAYVPPMPVHVPGEWLDAVPASQRDYAYVLAASPSPVDRLTFAGLIASMTDRTADVIHWAQGLSSKTIDYVVSAALDRTSMLRENLERLVKDTAGLNIRTQRMIQLCHDREDLRCVETILRLRGAEDLLEGALISIDAWVSENRARLPEALERDENDRLVEVACEDPEAWWGARMVTLDASDVDE